MKVLTKFLILIILCFSCTLPLEFTTNEAEYWNSFSPTQNNLFLTQIMNPLSNFNVENYATYVEAGKSLRMILKQFKTEFNLRHDTLKKVIPPLMFCKLHQLELQEWGNLDVQLNLIIKNWIKLSNVLVKYKYDENNRLIYIPKYATAAYYNKLTKAIDEKYATFYSINQTYNNLEHPCYDSINCILRERHQAKVSPSVFLPFKNNRTLSASYKPIFLPVTITINSKGQLCLSVEASVTTPIGVFSIKESIDFIKEKKMIIYYNDRKYVYAMGDKTVIFSVKKFTGEVNIEYQSSGDILINLINKNNRSIKMAA